MVTGAGRGLGLACAAALAEAGAAVTLVARTSSEIEDGAAQIRETGGIADAATLDILDLEAVSRFFRDRAAFHILVNNAGTNRPKPLAEVSEEDFDAVLQLNLKSLFFVTQNCVQQMLRERVAGSIIHIGSQMGHVGGPRRTLYCASKWAVEGLNKAMALDLAAHGIRSNTIAPTFIETSMTAAFLDDPDFRNSVLKNIKLGRLGQVEDIMGAVVFLAADASSLMTGASVVIDGGWTAE